MQFLKSIPICNNFLLLTICFYLKNLLQFSKITSVSSQSLTTRTLCPMSIYLTTWKIFFSQLLTICKVNDYPGIMGVMVTIKLLYYLDFLIFKQFKHLYFKKCLRLQVTTNVNTFRNALVFFHIQYTVASQRKAMSRIYR